MYVYRQVWSAESQLWHVSTLSIEHLLPTDISGFLVPSVHCLLQSLM